MTITRKSLKQHDYSKKVSALVRKGAELKSKSRALSAKLAETIKKCQQLLHPGKTP